MKAHYYTFQTIYIAHRREMRSRGISLLSIFTYFFEVRQLFRLIGIEFSSCGIIAVPPPFEWMYGHTMRIFINFLYALTKLWYLQSHLDRWTRQLSCSLIADSTLSADSSYNFNRFCIHVFPSMRRHFWHFDIAFFAKAEQPDNNSLLYYTQLTYFHVLSSLNAYGSNFLPFASLHLFSLISANRRHHWPAELWSEAIKFLLITFLHL